MCSTRQRLASLLRELRESRRLTLRQAANRAEIAASTLSRWESGACAPRVPELESLLKSLDADPEDVRRILVSLDVPRAARAVRSGADLDTETLAPSGGELLRAMRSRAGLSLVEVSLQLGVATSTVSRWESAAAHPPKAALDHLLDILQATPEERACVRASGVAKLKVERPDFEASHYRIEIARLEAAPVSDPALELRYLQLQSVLWWSQREPGAKELLRRVQVAYAKFLNAHRRYAEAGRRAEASLVGVTDRGEPLAIEAFRALAHADVYRWPIARPHLGLYTLQRALQFVRDDNARAGVLEDMAMYSELAGRMQEAHAYASRARKASAALVA